MLDARLTPWIKPLLRPVVSRLHRVGINADQVTVAGFLIGILAVPAIITGYFGVALVCIATNRLCDGIDGELARHTGSDSAAGGYLDICLDFLFYAAIPLGFGLADPLQWGAPALVLLCAFIGTGSSFLAFAVAAETYKIERPQFAHKSFYYMQGLTEGTETIVFFIAVCLWPQSFSLLAYIFATACFITVITRVAGGYKTLKQVAGDG
ncbi:CDP-alcohol phosphatidyltransferase family protein [Salinimonas sp. HHU 13199]|uniref:CDP-alcohol phosphatidyltransferase family protein n=1 Tax=Salinimonas profundi TaxID=2729140 RepID=A0ABR8LEV4_9ALTE|nr:CDP-alcohol phosphatidyltransferase family protein [Salinimonas profundi]MBD3584815.1 CDP-alcohol phosphatidyltransferase family protein [Salinimonas profundi]